MINVAEAREKANTFSSEYEVQSIKTSLILENLNPELKSDRFLIVAAELRGKSEEEIVAIFTGLNEAAQDENREAKEKEFFHTLAGTVYHVGEEVFGIDWH